jgi:hypothetical protein
MGNQTISAKIRVNYIHFYCDRINKGNTKHNKPNEPVRNYFRILPLKAVKGRWEFGPLVISNIGSLIFICSKIQDDNERNCGGGCKYSFSLFR